MLDGLTIGSVLRCDQWYRLGIMASNNPLTYHTVTMSTEIGKKLIRMISTEYFSWGIILLRHLLFEIFLSIKIISFFYCIPKRQKNTHWFWFNSSITYFPLELSTLLLGRFTYFSFLFVQTMGSSNPKNCASTFPLWTNMTNFHLFHWALSFINVYQMIRSWVNRCKFTIAYPLEFVDFSWTFIN